ncbi:MULTISPECIES: tRNA epoxyqueuosine(34) reductase QueG [unclassified Paenibacillus]|uniref:tRNA epoxyqueuosine(34) reductase QueG n=1 Tax=unclassified Paenibacillus TaxID=185978 RepID=UPI001AE872A7|nr:MULTISPECIES: tRNA epoxyqueuosine(34) reductase QueG [unclassified Paenibacillus]MBP1171728.1 epoxyqueuosine reductase [Paenibacillus sp. PvR098]MBP2438109.1 epoxyqueuosine reductase [Paenibacillus sp. PvP052]
MAAEPMEEPVMNISEAVVWAQLKEELRAEAPRLGIDKIGFASADPFADLKDILLKHREKGYESGFEERDIEKRVDPSLTLNAPRSIISIAVAYPSKLKDPPRSEPGAYRGILSRSAWGTDYHHVLRNRLERLEQWIIERVPGAGTASMVDTGALVDRAVAERAGIGWVGKNCSVITPEWGSWVYLGELITNVPFPPDTPVTESCGDCTLCIDACPTGALVGPGQLNAQLCVSYLTQTKGLIEDDELKRKIGNRLYGCDTCQIVCPKNKGIHADHHPELEPDPELVKPLLQPLLFLSNREFKERFGTSAAAWRGRKPIQRNAILALGNFRDVTAVPDLIRLLRTDDRPEIRGTAAWALGRIGGAEALEALEAAMDKEQDEAARRELVKALSQYAKGQQVELRDESN